MICVTCCLVEYLNNWHQLLTILKKINLDLNKYVMLMTLKPWDLRMCSDGLLSRQESRCRVSYWWFPVHFKKNDASLTHYDNRISCQSVFWAFPVLIDLFWCLFSKIVSMLMFLKKRLVEKNYWDVVGYACVCKHIPDYCLEHTWKFVKMLSI